MSIDYSPPMTKTKLTLSEKIFKITQACSAIQRNGVGYSSDPERPVYPYVKIEDVLAVVNPLLKRHKLILTGNVAKEPVTHVSKGYVVTEVLVDWTLQHAEGWGDNRTVEEMVESRTWRVPGSACDTQGKAIYKAITGSRKYAMVLIFNLKFGDEPEEVTNAPRSEKGPTGNDQPSVS